MTKFINFKVYISCYNLKIIPPTKRKNNLCFYNISNQSQVVIKHTPKFLHLPWWRNLHQGPAQAPVSTPRPWAQGWASFRCFLCHWNLWAAWEHRFSWIHRGSLKLGAGSLGQGMFANTFDCIVDNRDFVSNKADIFGVFHGGPVVKTLYSQFQEYGFNP